MDRVELGIKLEQINKLQEKGDYSGAAKVADTIEWRKVKKWSELSLAEELYEKAGRFKDARNICVYAYNRNLGGRRLIYKLTELSILINDLDEADDLYKEFVEMAPGDTSRYVLLYKLNKSRGVSTERLIEILEEYKDHELEEQYEYELASLYGKVGRTEDCIRECDDLILWFNEGEFVEKALLLKQEYTSLTKSQEEKLASIRYIRTYGPEESEEGENLPEGEEVLEDSRPKKPEIKASDIQFQEKDYSVYDTQNIQAELAKSMQLIMNATKKRQEADDLIELTPEPVLQEEEDEVDEPTKEIRVNTHHWNRITSVMEAPSSDSVITSVEAEAESLEEEVLEEGSGESQNQLDGQEPEEETGTEPILQKMEQPRPLEPVFSATPKYFEEEPVIPVEGQLSILDWLQEIPEPIEGEMELRPEVLPEVLPVAIPEEEPEVLPEVIPEVLPEATPEEEPEVLPEVIPEVSPEATPEEAAPLQELNSEEEEQVDQTLQEVMALLMAEVSEDLENQTSEDLVLPVEEQDLEAVEPCEPADKIPESVADKDTTPETEIPPEKEVDDSVIEQNEEESEEEYNLNMAERKYLKKYLFMKGMEESVVKVIHGKKKEMPDGTSSFGNIVISGKSEIDKTTFAINLFKALHTGQDQSELKVAKTSAAVLNRKGISASVEKIRGTTLIVENVGMLSKETARKLSDFMEEQTGSMLVIFTGEDYEVKRLFSEHPHLGDKFSYAIELKHYSVNELVAIAKEYARVKGYMIEDKALLKLYLKVGEIASNDVGVEMDRVKEIIDGAIQVCGKKRKTLFGGRGGSFIPLKEKYFL